MTEAELDRQGLAKGWGVGVGGACTHRDHLDLCCLAGRPPLSSLPPSLPPSVLAPGLAPCVAWCAWCRGARTKTWELLSGNALFGKKLDAGKNMTFDQLVRGTLWLGVVAVSPYFAICSVPRCSVPCCSRLCFAVLYCVSE